MPADRARPSKRAAQPKGDARRSSSRAPARPADSDPPSPRAPTVLAAAAATPDQGFAFAQTLTPGTYLDPPTKLEFVTEPLLFPANPTDGGAKERRAAHAKKKPENHIPRPPNAFILFRSSFIKSQHVSSEVETNHSTLSKIIGLTWQNLPNEERQVWHAKAKAALEEHRRKFPQYAFRPLHTKGKAPEPKRKVREVEPKDLKRCAKIAELLIEGKKGAALNAAIQEFDRHHVPQVVTRFEAPITARHYRRSSSAPAPDTEHNSDAPFFKVEPASPAKRKSSGRSSSSRPEIVRSASTESFDSYATPAPSSPPPSEPDTESDYYSSPSSPFPVTPTYGLSANPSFEFSTFSWDTSAAPTMPSYSACDPLDRASPVFETYTPDAHAQQQQSPDACVPQFDCQHLSIDTSFMDCWTTSSSPLSSVPGTPQTYPALHDAHAPGLGDFLGDVFDPSADGGFLPQHADAAALYGSYCAPDFVAAYGSAAQTFGAIPPKGDFSSFYADQGHHQHQHHGQNVFAQADYISSLSAGQFGI
ncbi:uncharacterized protein BXZ73DRAFT_53509 [Epithele typhae]|uniref:uncharacterized protein n=1 Tax=Epithele typhae TaxID=378194 RepID=UPI002007FBA4|nr:uncharacterized protein BXZ73DRAFT_53509 [Epithele typhae]KAH9916943.1 hypothetical protein BXZ73DRAFT_53509 [Epithele typhae]